MIIKCPICGKESETIPDKADDANAYKYIYCDACWAELVMKQKCEGEK